MVAQVWEPITWESELGNSHEILSYQKRKKKQRFQNIFQIYFLIY